MTAKQHYDTHLGKVYSWMLGDFSHRMSEQKHFFMKHQIQPSGNAVAFDLGAGNGIQSVALASIGFKVNAVDFNKQLLDELLINKQNLPIETFHQEILQFLNESTESAELVVCMGDTLTHFANYDEVRNMIGRIAKVLPKGGKVVFSYRDLSEERKGVDRFLHVKSDAERSMTCFLEYFRHHVLVYDLIVEKYDGEWIQKVSNYPKLRIPALSLKNTLMEYHIGNFHEEVMRGMTYITAEKI